MRKKLFGFAISSIFAIGAIWGATCAARFPSNDRDWSPDQAQLARATVNGPLVTIENVRNNVYRTTSDYDVRYEKRTYDLRKLDSAWFGVERFGPPAVAHTFICFGFGDDYLAVSAEIRKEKGENYSVVRGLADEYEMMYVVGDERDIIGLRTNYRKDEVHLYPVNTTPERMRGVFLDVIGRVNKLAGEPEFYNSLTNTCTTSIVRHVNRIAPKRIPFSMSIVLPGYSDRLAYELGVIGGSEPFEKTQAEHRIDLIAQQHGIREDFSRAIRRQK